MAETRIKICGLTRPEDARRAVEAGAHYLGFVFAESPRQVEPSRLADWLGQFRESAELVGVFRDQPLDFVRETQQSLDLDLVQLHGAERGDDWIELPVRVLEARAVGGEGVAASRFHGAAWADLLDTASEQGGGSGRVFDWDLALDLARSRRVFLAGGLDPDNVTEAIQRVAPFAVDVSSGVESAPGIKDASRLVSFCDAVRRS